MRNFGIEIECLLPNGLGRDGATRREMLAAAVRSEGVDCNVEAYGHSTPTVWKIVTDQTIGYDNGAELVSPILDIDADGLAQVEAVCRALARVNARVNRDCGLHVHHDMRGESFGTWKNIAKLHARYEASMDSLVPPSRRANINRWCKSNVASVSGYGSNNPVADVFAKVDACTNLNELREMQHGNSNERRYHKLNLEASAQHNTVEFRGHGGTVEFEKMQAWVLLTSAIVEGAKTRSNTPIGCTDSNSVFELMMREMTGEDGKKVRRFLRKRRALLGA
tara:strand:+ start:2249 stop:3085 length:837 start_codon:yes stop_codon:yes gene_type:complete